MSIPVLFGISGGNSFRDESQMHRHYQNFDIDYVHTEKYWMDWMDWILRDVFDCTKLKMVGLDNANYGVWKILFEKYLEKIKEKNLNIVAHSLGTTFILKYLTENDLKVKSLHIIAPFVADEFQPADFNESTGSFTFDYKNVRSITRKCDNIHIWYSEDDNVCTSKHALYLHEQLPESRLTALKGRGHFNQGTFWELIEDLKSKNCV